MRRVVHPFKQARDHATGNRELVAKESLSADEQIEGVVCDRRGSFLKNVTFRPSGIAYGQASFLLPRLSPAPRAANFLIDLFLGFRCAPPQALCYHPLRGLVEG